MTVGRNLNRDRRLEIAAVAALLVLAGALRLASPGLSEFKADEARLLTLALQMSDGQFALRGISSSTGFPNFPMSVWLYMLPLLVWQHPYSAILFTGLLNTLAVGLSYWMARRYWGVMAALAATLMFAVSPWAVIFSRKIWAQNLLPLIVVGWAFAALLAYVDRRKAFIILHLLCLAVAIQIHLAAIALLPATVAFLIIFRRRVDWRMALLGLALALLTALPFLVYLGRIWRASGGLPAVAAATGSEETIAALVSLRSGAMLTTGSDLQSLAGSLAAPYYLARLPGITVVHWLWGLLALAGAMWMALRWWRDRDLRENEAGFVVLLWTAAPLLFFALGLTPVYLHYFIALLPAPYLLAGVLFRDVVAKWRRPGKATAWLGLLLSAGLQVYALVLLLNLVASTATPGAYGTPLRYKLAAVDAAREQLRQSGATELLVAGPGADPVRDEFAAEFQALLYGMPVRYVNTDHEALFPAEAAVVVLAASEGSNPAHDLYRASAGVSTGFPLRPGEGEYTVLWLPAAAAPPPFHPLEEPALLANWVVLEGHDDLQQTASEEALWLLHWRPGDNPDPRDYHFFAHLLDGNGVRVAQVDAPAFSPDQWQAGDRVASYFLLPVDGDPPRLSIRTGMYTYPDLAPVQILDTAGNPAGEWLELPLD